MSDYTINDMREDLAKTMKALLIGDKDMTVEKAKAISELGQTMINSAKVEVEALKVLGRGSMKPTGFIAIEHQDTLDLQEGKTPPPQLPAPKPHVRNPMGSAPIGRI